MWIQGGSERCPGSATEEAGGGDLLGRSAQEGFDRGGRAGGRVWRPSAGVVGWVTAPGSGGSVQREL